MKTQSDRLFFIDAMRAWAILMMLQGHFIDGLLDPVFRDSSNPAFNIWLYFRGITAPVFFTVSGFIFTYLLVRAPQVGWGNPRVKKGIRRGLQLLLIGYALRLNLFGLFKGEIYGAFYLVDVLHCIGLSILAIVGVYLFASKKKKYVFPLLMVGITMVLFLFEPIYKQFSYDFLPVGIANYLIKANGSVFTIIPWLGYATIGGALALLFRRFKDFKYLYPSAITLAILMGSLLIFYSSPFFVWINETSGIGLFNLIQSNNYLFIRLGDVFLVFAVFMLIRRVLTNKAILKIGASTLTIYVVHFIILYGSFTGLGLYRFLHHELSPWITIFGAGLFMFACTYIALQYNQNEAHLKEKWVGTLRSLRIQLYSHWKKVFPIFREQLSKLRVLVLRFFASARN